MMREMFDDVETSPGVLAERIRTTRGGVSKLIDRLVGKEFVTRADRTDDRRFQSVALTAAGRRLVPQLAALAYQNDEELFGPLPPRERTALLDSMKKLIQAHGLETLPTEWGEQMSRQVIHETGITTQQGKMNFPQVVGGLLEAGVESYLVDFATRQKTHYLSDGTTHTVPTILEPGPISAEFSGEDLVAAIRGAQADTVRYPEFVKRAAAAGVVGYRAFLTGERVIYFGRKGEQHIEEFPRPKT